MRLGKEIEWDDIEVGEIFAADGCLGILEKRGKNRALVLAVQWSGSHYTYNMEELVGKSLKTIAKYDKMNLLKNGHEDDTFYFGGYYSRRKSGTGFYKLDKKIQNLWRTE